MTLCLLCVSQTEGLNVVWRSAMTHSDLLISVCRDNVLIIWRQRLEKRRRDIKASNTITQIRYPQHDFRCTTVKVQEKCSVTFFGDYLILILFFLFFIKN